MTNNMNAVSKQDFKTNIIEFFEKESGLKVETAIAKLKAEVVVDKWGNTQKERIKAGNVVLFYVNNPNYCGGVKNGYGKGIYISNSGFTGGSTIKLNNWSK